MVTKFYSEKVVLENNSFGDLRSKILYSGFTVNDGKGLTNELTREVGKFSVRKGMVEGILRAIPRVSEETEDITYQVDVLLTVVKSPQFRVELVRNPDNTLKFKVNKVKVSDVKGQGISRRLDEEGSKLQLTISLPPQLIFKGVDKSTGINKYHRIALDFGLDPVFNYINGVIYDSLGTEFGLDIYKWLMIKGINNGPSYSSYMDMVKLMGRKEAKRFGLISTFEYVDYCDEILNKGDDELLLQYIDGGTDIQLPEEYPTRSHHIVDWLSCMRFTSQARNAIKTWRSSWFDNQFENYEYIIKFAISTLMDKEDWQGVDTFPDREFILNRLNERATNYAEGTLYSILRDELEAKKSKIFGKQ